MKVNDLYISEYVIYEVGQSIGSLGSHHSDAADKRAVHRSLNEPKDVLNAASVLGLDAVVLLLLVGQRICLLVRDLCHCMNTRELAKAGTVNNLILYLVVAQTIVTLKEYDLEYKNNINLQMSCRSLAVLLDQHLFKRGTEHLKVNQGGELFISTRQRPSYTVSGLKEDKTEYRLSRGRLVLTVLKDYVEVTNSSKDLLSTFYLDANCLKSYSTQSNEGYTGFFTAEPDLLTLKDGVFAVKIGWKEDELTGFIMNAAKYGYDIMNVKNE